jgi:hypothetical protein
MVLNHAFSQSIRLSRRSVMNIPNINSASGSRISFTTSSILRDQNAKPSVGSTPSESAAERMQREEESARTHFGFRDVAEEDKAGLGKWAGSSELAVRCMRY